MRLTSAAIATLSVALAGCEPFGVVIHGGDDEQRDIVGSVLSAWFDAAAVSPRLRAVRFVEEVVNGDRPVYGMYKPGVVQLQESLTGRDLVGVMHHEIGHAFDYSRIGLYSSDPYWTAYDREREPYDRGRERYADTAELGPDGLRLIPEPGATDCALQETADDAAVVRADLLRPGGLELQPAAPVARSVRLPRGGWVSAMFGLGEEGVGFRVSFDDDRVPFTFLIPDLDLPEVYAWTLDGTRWSDLDVDRSAPLGPPPAPSTWAPGFGMELAAPTPIGDGETQLSRVRLDHTKKYLEKDELDLVIETTVDSGEVVAVHDAHCAAYTSLEPPSTVVPSSEGVWLISTQGDQVTMRCFPTDGAAKPVERWVVEGNPFTVVREQ